MTDKQALLELAERIERGDTQNVSDVSSALRPNSLVGTAADCFHGNVREAVQRGSLDAAKALHDAVLQGWRVKEIQDLLMGLWNVDLMEIHSEGGHSGGDWAYRLAKASARTPAAAWVSAILRAKAQVEQETDQ